MVKQIERKPCKNCIHYQFCVDTFRKAKQGGEVLIEEEAYFADAGNCDYYADERIYRKQIEGEWEEPPFIVEIIASSDENYWDKLDEKKYEANNPYRCGVCKGRTKTKTKFCPNCGAKMKGE